MEFPAYLQQKLTEQYGRDTAEEIRRGCLTGRRTTLRVNRLRSSREETERMLREAGLPYERVGWFEDALVLEHGRERDLAALSAYAEGGFYIQSLSSMIPPLLLDAQAGESILDMAAAPGGKTTEIASLTGGRAMITACERNAARLERLKANLMRQGAGRVTVLHQDARQLDELFSFDRVLLDAPCSGSGTWGEGSRGRFEPQLLKKTAAQQKALLEKALRLTRIGGTVVYSTCSVLQEENEDIVLSALQRGGCGLIPADGARFADVPRLPSRLEGALLIAPTERYEGFFTAALRKTGKAAA